MILIRKSMTWTEKSCEVVLMILTVCSIRELFHCSISLDCLTFGRQHLPQTTTETLFTSCATKRSHYSCYNGRICDTGRANTHLEEIKPLTALDIGPSRVCGCWHMARNWVYWHIYGMYPISTSGKSSKQSLNTINKAVGRPRASMADLNNIMTTSVRVAVRMESLSLRQEYNFTLKYNRTNTKWQLHVQVLTAESHCVAEMEFSMLHFSVAFSSL